MLKPVVLGPRLPPQTTPGFRGKGSFFFLFFFSLFDERKMVGRAINVVIIPRRDHSSTLLAEFRVLLEYKRTSMNHSFPAPREILVNLELLRGKVSLPPKVQKLFMFWAIKHNLAL